MNPGNGTIKKILSVFESGLFIKILSVFESVLWIAGLILANIYLIILAFVILIAILLILYPHKDNLKEIFQGDSNVIVEDERTQLINEKSATMTLGIFIAVVTYVAIIILALRNSFPDWTLTGYTLLGSALFCLIIYLISRAYYSRKYE